MITYILAAAVSYIVAFLFNELSDVLIFLHLVLVVYIIFYAKSMKAAVVSTTIVGILTIVPTLSFFWTIAGHQAIPLWIMLIAWQALAAMLSRLAIDKFGGWGYALCPVILTVLLYARCELYPLRFAMSTPINALSPKLINTGSGSFGCIFLLTSWGAIALRIDQIAEWVEGRSWPIASTALFLIPAAMWLTPIPTKDAAMEQVEVVGIPLEAGARGMELQFFPESYLLRKLDEAAYYKMGGQLFVLPEYAISAEPSQAILQWCKRQGVYLIIGGRKFENDGSNFTNTAFVINPKGEIEFSQGKVQPIQTAPDGLPATSQQLWNSPWGKIGIVICYDLTFTRVCDALVRQGAQAIICPAMDLKHWGAREHDLNARFARIRAAEYGIPVLRVVSSGPSELVGKNGLVDSSNGWTDQFFEGMLSLGRPGRMPVDRLFLGLLPSLVRTPRAG